MRALRHGDTLDVGQETVAEATDGRRWCQLFPWGRRHRADYPDGHIDYDAAFFAGLLRTWQAAGKQPLPIDYFHRGHSIDGDGNSIDDKIAAGWIHDIDVRDGKGAWALIEWTPKAKEHIKAGELRYLSPTFMLATVDAKTGKRTGPRLMSAGLLNDPFFTDMPRVAASESSTPPVKERSMDKKMLCAAFGVPEETPDEKILEMANAYAQMLKKQSEEKPAEKPEELAKQTALFNAAASEAKALRQTVTTLQGELAQAAAKLGQVEVDRLLEKHASRILPAQRDVAAKLCQALGVADAEKMIAAWPVVAPAPGVVGHGSPGEETPEKALSKLNAHAAELRKADPTLDTSAAFRAACRAFPTLYRQSSSSKEN